MTRSVEWRERAVDTASTPAEDTEFPGRRAGLEVLARWAAESFGFDEPARAAYVATIMDRFLAGANETDLVLRVRSDLERAGKPALSSHAETVFSRAKATAMPRRADARPGRGN